MRIKIYDNGKPRFIGDYTANTFTKHVKYSKHFMIKYSSYGLDGHYFVKVLKPNNATIMVIDDESKKIYMTDAETMDKKGIWRTYPPHGAQIFLPLIDWNSLTM